MAPSSERKAYVSGKTPDDAAGSASQPRAMASFDCAWIAEKLETHVSSPSSVARARAGTLA